MKSTTNNSNKSILSMDSVKAIYEHDIEVAAFVIVAVSLVGALSSYALDSKKIIDKKVINRDPVAVALQDINGDNIKDIILVHRDGTREVVITESR